MNKFSDKKVIKISKFFFKNDICGSIFLISATIISIILSNIEVTNEIYNIFLGILIKLKIGRLEINKNVLSWINDALMTIFFLLLGLEIKRELTYGVLSNYKQAIFPIVAAIGGIIVPAFIYTVFNYYNPVNMHGWAIPTATDVAFMLSILSLLGNLVPKSLKIFLMTLAVIDDLCSAIIIALFYNDKILVSSLSLYITLISVIILLIFNICNLQKISIYLFMGIILWISILKSGIHASISGVIVGFFIPIKTTNGKKSPAKILENAIYPWVYFLILPLFAFANSGISLKDIKISEFISSLSLGIISALFIGKPLGISIFCWLALKSKLANLPCGTTYDQIAASSILCGIGFTMSIFISTLAFNNSDHIFIIYSKLGILVGSLLSSIIGYIFLKNRLSSSY